MEESIVEGNISVKAVLQAKRRTVTRIMVDKKKKDKDTAYILHRAQEQHVDIVYVERDVINQMAQGATHGGLIALCGERCFQDIATCLHTPSLFLACIEGIEDPFNFGNILRTLYAAGCDGVIIPKRNWTSAVNVVTRASAGASEYMPLFVSEKIEDTIQQIKKEHVPFVCAHRFHAISLYAYTFPPRVCIAIGGEMRGLSKPVLQQSEQNIYIPYRQDFRNAMSAASATAIVAFEYVRQRQSL